MTPHEYMRKQMHGIAGGIAWTQKAFTDMPPLAPGALVDAAVDIAWERFKSRKPTPPELEITKRGNLIVFRPRPHAAEGVLA